MHRILVGSALLIVAAGAAFFTPPIQNLLKVNQAPSRPVASNLKTKNAKLKDPNIHDFDDIDYAQKKVIHHQLAAMIADKAKTDAIRAEVRQIADQVSARETARANTYAALLKSWNETYLNITDFPDTGGCNGYPTFSGMLPHLDVGNYRLSSGENVDTKFFTLLIEHHKKAADLVNLEGAKIGFGELIKLQKTTQAEYKAEISQLETFQKSMP